MQYKDGFLTAEIHFSTGGSMTLDEQLERYIPFNEQEEKDRDEIRRWLKRDPADIYTRKNTAAHISASAWVVSPDRQKVLMAYHNIYESWAWLGGHADGETDLLKVAVKEVKEESGIDDVRPLDEDIFSVEVLSVDGHIKNGEYVSTHVHLNITYLLEADPSLPLHHKADENKAVSWIARDDVYRMCSEKWFNDHIYSKLTEKVKERYG